MTPSEQRAHTALLSAARQVLVVEPMAPVLVRSRRELEGIWNPADLITHWLSRTLGNLAGSDRYRWELTHQRGTGFPGYAGPPETWKPWRPSESDVAARDIFAFEERLTGPIVAFESAELLSEARNSDPRAEALLLEADPVLRRDVAQFALERNAWADTFGAWTLTRYPATFARILPVLVAVAESYAARARRSEGVVHGTRYPFHDRPLVSASAQLASTLLTLGHHFDVAARAIDFVSRGRRSDGGWGDSGEASDVMTTLVAADLLASCDSEYDPLPTRLFFETRQETSGFWRALGPEMPWLTTAVLHWLGLANQPFAARFRWPRVQSANLDRKTRLPFFHYFAEVARLFDALPGLRRAFLDVGFIDLIGFREFNNRYGQARGDDALELFAELLGELPNTRAIRDGGDEFLVLAAPTSRRLCDRLSTAFRNWPGRFRRRFGDDAPPVLARGLVATSQGSALLEVRQALGRGIAELKHETPDPRFGILREIAL